MPKCGRGPAVFNSDKGTGEKPMYEHPILGAVLFILGTILIAAAYAAGNGADTADAVIAGHVLVFNGALLAALGTGHQASMQRRLASVAHTRR